jgi:Asp-tRNA(Asn)/Glu-tRNA(Gln) amidotransferase A subunit family amidase
VLIGKTNTPEFGAVNGVPQHTCIGWLRTCSRITVTGHPAVSVPAGFTAGGLPVGLQLAGRYGSDDRLLTIAEAVAGVLLPEPARPVSLASRDISYPSHDRCSPGGMRTLPPLCAHSAGRRLREAADI